MDLNKIEVPAGYMALLTATMRSLHLRDYRWVSADGIYDTMTDEGTKVAREVFDVALAKLVKYKRVTKAQDADVYSLSY